MSTAINIPCEGTSLNPLR